MKKLVLLSLLLSTSLSAQPAVVKRAAAQPSAWSYFFPQSLQTPQAKALDFLFLAAQMFFHPIETLTKKPWQNVIAGTLVLGSISRILASLIESAALCIHSTGSRCYRESPGILASHASLCLGF